MSALDVAIEFARVRREHEPRQAPSQADLLEFGAAIDLTRTKNSRSPLQLAAPAGSSRTQRPVS